MISAPVDHNTGWRTPSTAESTLPYLSDVIPIMALYAFLLKRLYIGKLNGEKFLPPSLPADMVVGDPHVLYTSIVFIGTNFPQNLLFED